MGSTIEVLNPHMKSLGGLSIYAKKICIGILYLNHFISKIYTTPDLKRARPIIRQFENIQQLHLHTLTLLFR
ncbi:hypothetical protein PS623_04622 [Pseudomonas fluorescens]|nr:hypothetical protein PS623_04622 [Pseudomonas fluorescens]